MSLIFLYSVGLSSRRLSIHMQAPLYLLRAHFHAGHARQQLHSTRGRGVQTQADKKQALTITTSNLQITQITISTSTVPRYQRLLIFHHPESGIAPIGKE
jgi:hypothetical protein